MVSALPVAGVRAQGAKVDTPLTAEQKLYAELMQTIFGENYRLESRDALAELPDVNNCKINTVYVINAIAHTVLSTGEPVLVANAEVAREDGTAFSSNASPGILNVFILKKTDDKWQLIKRHETVATLGSFGQLGDIVWTDLAQGKPGLAVLHGGTWQGYSIVTLSLFDLGAEQLHDLIGESIAIHSDSDGGCNPEEGKCWSVTGDWQFSASRTGAVYDDIVIKFSGEKSQPQVTGREPPPEGVKRVMTKIKNLARYAYDGKRYQLVVGENVVPGI
ncbi:MAG: hypothetical protein H7252_07245 [Cytophaga sp.]|nr:hypothetical protein [Undibacterium sp.]